MTGSLRHLVSAEAQKLVTLLSERPPDPRRVARQVVELRSCFEWEGHPDWAGRSQDYRDIIYRVYKDAGIPTDSLGGLQSKLRYHIGNAVREAAAPEALVALGLGADVGDQASDRRPSDTAPTHVRMPETRLGGTGKADKALASRDRNPLAIPHSNSARKVEPAWRSWLPVLGWVAFMILMFYLALNGFAFPFGDPSCPGGNGSPC